MSDNKQPLSHDHATDDQGFFDKPKNIKAILMVFYVICGLLVLADFVVHRHIYVYFEELPTFYAAYGFVACVVLVLLAKVMRVLLMRDEDYYDAPNSSENSQDGENGRLG